MTTANDQQQHTGSAKLTMPSRLITDRRFRYVDHSKTDVRRTFRKARLLMRLQGAAA